MTHPSVRITKRVLEFILPTQLREVYTHKPKRKIGGRLITLYSTNSDPDNANLIGVWSGGLFMSEDSKLINTITSILAH